MAGGSKKVIIISLCANFGVALTKLAGSFYTGSAALLAEAVHSFSDCGNQMLLLYGQHASKKGPDERYPLGHSKELFFWSFIVALLLFTMGGMFSIYEGIHKIQHSEPLHAPIVGIAILLVAICLEGYALRACLKEVRKENTYGTLWQWVRRTMSADLLVIFLEDMAALLGLTLALMALTLSWATGDAFWDGLGSCVIGLLLIAVAVVLAIEVKHMLVGERPAREYEPEMQAMLKTAMPGATLLKLVALQRGANSVMVAYKIQPGDLSAGVGEVMQQVNAYEKQVKTRFPEIQWQFAELDDKV